MKGIRTRMKIERATTTTTKKVIKLLYQHKPYRYSIKFLFHFAKIINLSNKIKKNKKMTKKKKD